MLRTKEETPLFWACKCPAERSLHFSMFAKANCIRVTDHRWNERHSQCRSAIMRSSSDTVTGGLFGQTSRGAVQLSCLATSKTLTGRRCRLRKAKRLEHNATGEMKGQQHWKKYRRRVWKRMELTYCHSLRDSQLTQTQQQHRGRNFIHFYELWIDLIIPQIRISFHCWPHNSSLFDGRPLPYRTEIRLKSIVDRRGTSRSARRWAPIRTRQYSAR